jgi:hypothetical protein
MEQIFSWCFYFFWECLMFNVDPKVWAERAYAATDTATQALTRLLEFAETRRSDQSQVIAQFFGALWIRDGEPRAFDFYNLRLLDVQISDDMLAIIDFVRWGRCSIGDLIIDGHIRIETMLEAWGMFGESQNGQQRVASTDTDTD